MHPPHRSIRALHTRCAALALAPCLLALACVGGVPNVATQQAEYDRAMYFQRQSEDPEVGRSKAAPRGEPEISWAEHAKRGRAFLAVGQEDEAEAELLASLEATQAFPARDARTRAAVKNLGTLADRYAREGNHEGTIRITPRWIAALQQVGGPGDPLIPLAWQRLGEARLAQGNAAAASADLERSLQLYLKQAARQYGAEAEANISLAHAYEQQGKLAQAESTYRRAVEDYDARGAEERGLALSLNALAWFYASQGRYAEAEPFARRALDVAERFALPRFEVAQIHDTLATTLAGLGLDAEAEAEYELAVQKSRGAPNILRGYAAFLREAGRTKEADALLERAESAEAPRTAVDRSRSEPQSTRPGEDGKA